MITIKRILILAGVTALVFLYDGVFYDVQAKEEQTVSRQHPVTSEIRIPTDIPYPSKGNGIIIPIATGATIRFKDGFSVDFKMTELDRSLEIRPSGYGTIVLEGFFDNHDIPPRLFLGDDEFDLDEFQTETNMSEMLAALEDGNEFRVTEEMAAGGGARGGGEVFGLVQVISWFLDQIDVASVAHAQGISDEKTPLIAAPAGNTIDESPLVKQLLAQMQIARALAIQRHAKEYVTLIRQVRDQINMRVESGVSSRGDIDVAEAAVLQARLELEEAGFNLDLAVDRHQDMFHQRLAISVFPSWDYTAGDSLTQQMSRVPPELQSSSRRYWRQVHFTRKTQSMLDSLMKSVDRFSKAYRAQFDIGQRTLSDLLIAIQSRFQVQVRMVKRQYDLKTAEGWLMAAEGKLKSDVLLHPGWQ